jgi:hypothetical protein
MMGQRLGNKYQYLPKIGSSNLYVIHLVKWHVKSQGRDVIDKFPFFSQLLLSTKEMTDPIKRMTEYAHYLVELAVVEKALAAQGKIIKDTAAKDRASAKLLRQYNGYI